MSDHFRCQVCASANLDEIAEFGDLMRVTSDCRPFQDGGRLVECVDCGTTQKLPTERWLSEIATIYAAYTPYHQAEGVEQIVLDSETGTLRRRSEVIVSRLQEQGCLPEQGRALDVGCGSGATLKILSRELPGWLLYGNELDDKGHKHLASIPRFRKLFTCRPGDIPGSFDLVTSIHSLEHFPAPFEVLAQLRARMSESGRLFIQLYNSAENPFDLVIADHLMHFTPRTLARIVERAGFLVEMVESSWIPKELSLIARHSHAPHEPTFSRYPELRNRRRSVRWLRSVVEDAEIAAREAKAFGIFGTSIAATWLAASLSDRVRFFVDEDPLRQGREYMGHPVVRPAEARRDAKVFLALAPAVAANVRRRLEPLGLDFVSPRVPA